MHTMKNKPKIYATESFKNVVDMFRTKNEFSKRVNVSNSQVTGALKGSPLQANFVAAIIHEMKVPFESLFEVR